MLPGARDVQYSTAVLLALYKYFVYINMCIYLVRQLCAGELMFMVSYTSMIFIHATIASAGTSQTVIAYCEGLGFA